MSKRYRGSALQSCKLYTDVSAALAPTALCEQFSALHNFFKRLDNLNSLFLTCISKLDVFYFFFSPSSTRTQTHHYCWSLLSVTSCLPFFTLTRKHLVHVPIVLLFTASVILAAGERTDQSLQLKAWNETASLVLRSQRRVWKIKCLARDGRQGI